MTEKTKVTGEVMAYSNPFSHRPPINEILMVQTDKGLICVPVKSPEKYAIHQSLEISIVIKEVERS